MPLKAPEPLQDGQKDRASNPVEGVRRAQVGSTPAAFRDARLADMIEIRGAAWRPVSGHVEVQGTRERIDRTRLFLARDAVEQGTGQQKSRSRSLRT
jgi:hypothetical protein